MQHHQAIELEILEGDAHRRSERRRILAFHFYAYAATVLEHQEIELGALMGRPEIGRLGGVLNFYHRHAA